MGKKRSAVPSPVVSTRPEDRISALGFRLMAAGGLCVLAGFVLLWFSDPSGRNWASHLSPFFIVGGYGLLGFGLVCPEKTA